MRFKLSEWLPTKTTFTLAKPPKPPLGSEAIARLYEHKNGQELALLYSDSLNRVWYRLVSKKQDFSGRTDYTPIGEWLAIDGQNTRGEGARLRNEQVLGRVSDYLKTLGRPASARETRAVIAAETQNLFGHSPGSAYNTAAGLLSFIWLGYARGLYCLNPEAKPSKRLYAFEEGKNKRYDNAPVLKDLKTEITGEKDLV